MTAILSGRRATAWSKKKPRLRRRFTLSMVIMPAWLRGCDEKVTRAPNVVLRPNSWLAERANQVTLPAPNHGRFLLHLSPACRGFFLRARGGACARIADVRPPTGERTRPEICSPGDYASARGH